MKLNTANRYVSLVMFGMLAGSVGGHAEDIGDKAKAVKESVQTSIYDLTDKDTVVISFEKGSSTFPADKVAELRTTLNAVRSDASIKEVIVATYSDMDYPRDQKNSLPSASVKLAERRGNEVKKKLTELGAKNVTVYNMGEKASWFEKTFSTETAQVKNESAQNPSKMSDDDAFHHSLGRQLVSKGGAQKVVVVIRNEIVKPRS